MRLGRGLRKNHARQAHALNDLKARFSATLGEEPEVELALV